MSSKDRVLSMEDANVLAISSFFPVYNTVTLGFPGYTLFFSVGVCRAAGQLIGCSILQNPTCSGSEYSMPHRLSLYSLHSSKDVSQGVDALASLQIPVSLVQH